MQTEKWIYRNILISVKVKSILALSWRSLPVAIRKTLAKAQLLKTIFKSTAIDLSDRRLGFGAKIDNGK